MSEFTKKINVIGLGYIGLPTASLLANRGYYVTGVDVSEKVVDALNKGEILIVEPGLDVMVKAAVGSGRLKASTVPTQSDIFVIAVPTPFKGNHVPDISYIELACRNISPVLEEGNLIIIESTSPVGTTEKVSRWIRQSRPELNNIYFSYCPERVLPGKILEELIGNDRVVGGLDREASKMAADFYGSFVEGEILVTNAKTAELCKLTENASRDVSIAFANELSMVCDQMDIDVWELIDLANHHPRVNILQPGPGVGGHCIAVDPWFIVSSCPDMTELIQAARNVNDSKPDWVVEKVTQAANKFGTKPVIACFGAAFKPDIDDLRESPSLKIIRKLHDLGVGEILVCEPHVNKIEGIKLVEVYEAINTCNIAVFLVAHSDFKKIKRSQLESKIVIDTQGIWR